MQNYRTYGAGPYQIALLHGGPGGAGYMAPVARELAQAASILEPLQTADSLQGQIAELHATLQGQATPPVTLVGSSWGAILGYLYAAHYPEQVQKLVMVGSGVYEEAHTAPILMTRLSRLSPEERAKVNEWIVAMNDPHHSAHTDALLHLVTLFARTDSYDPLTLDLETIEVRQDIHLRVMADLRALRQNGELLALGKQVRCPVVALHGDHDPHLWRGVKSSLSNALDDFRFILLDRCGHYPWIERHAREPFFDLLRSELEI